MWRQSGSSLLDSDNGVEEMKGPVPPPRPAIPPMNDSGASFASTASGVGPEHGQATQSLLHTQEVARDFFDMVGRPTGDVIGGRTSVPLNEFCEKDQEFLAY
ncbi:unnamed protein product, partial [Sphacelaria rigidula]